MLWVPPHVLFCPVVAVLVHQSCCCAGNGGAPQAAAQSPVPITRAASPVPMPEEGPALPFAASGPSPVFGFGPADADRHASQPASDEPPEAQDAGVLLSQPCD